MSGSDHEHALSAMIFRENLIKRARQMVETARNKNLLHGRHGHGSKFLAHEMTTLAKELRDYGLRCVMRITALGKEKSKEEDDYLVKMLTDLDFLHEAFPKGPFYLADPLLMMKEKNIETTLRRSCSAATLVILDTVARKCNMTGSLVATSPIEAGAESSGCQLKPSNMRNKKHKEDMTKTNTEKERPFKDFDIDEYYASQSIINADVHHTDHTIGINRADIISGKNFKYRKMDLIGRGAYAKVYNCLRQDGQKFAIKIFDPVNREEDDEETAQYTKITVLREIEFLKKLKRHTLIEVEEMIGTGENTMLVLEKMDMTLLDLRVNRSRGKPAQVEVLGCYVMSQVCDAISYLHSMNVVHRDIKPENILVRNYGQVVKLADLGSSVEVIRTNDAVAQKLLNAEGRIIYTSSDEGPGTLTNYVGSRWYRSPEVLANGTNYGYASDVWAFGCTFAEFVCGSPIFMGESEQDVLDSIVCYYASIPTSVQTALTSRGLKFNRPSIRNTFHTKLSLLSAEMRNIMQRIFMLDADERAVAPELSQELSALASQYIPDDAAKKSFFDNDIKHLYQ